MKKFKPPTIEQVQAYIDLNNYDVNAREFVKYYEAGEPPWHDQNGHPVRSWKQKLIAVWAKKPKAKNCWCGKTGVYVAKDDTQQDYWLCEDHKPKPKPLPDDMPVPELKGVGSGVNVSNERNRQKDRLGVK